ncbi:MAG: hypothetical protein WC875_02050 [Candidatus Absconditabacterales bacterium]|jgi:hypothetical protein
MKGTLQYAKTLAYLGEEFTDILQAIFGDKQELTVTKFKKKSHEQTTSLAEKDEALMLICRKNYLWPDDDPVENFIGICTRANYV